MYDFFFGQLFGLYFLIIGLVVIGRQKSLMPIVAELAHNRALLFVIPFLELAAGLALVLAYPVIGMSLGGLISLVGWMLVVESLFYLTMPHKWTERMIKKFNSAPWYTGGGACAVVFGAYLAALGFGLM